MDSMAAGTSKGLGQRGKDMYVQQFFLLLEENKRQHRKKGKCFEGK